jgi:glycosyltransferase involved in cell wall biosynthesis
MEPRLVLAGYGSESLKSNKDLSRLLMRAGNVSVLGSVESDALRDLYRGADALIVPSLAEGFCLPALEARSVGTRVICRPVPAIEELVTDDDVVARDLSVEALVDAIYTGAIADRHAREIAYEDLERFSLRAVAERTRSVYGSVLARDSRIFLGDRRVA